MEIYAYSYRIRFNVYCKLGDIQKPNYIHPHVHSFRIIIKQINRKIDLTWLTVGCTGAWFLMWRLLCGWSRFIQFVPDHMWYAMLELGVESGFLACLVSESWARMICDVDFWTLEICERDWDVLGASTGTSCPGLQTIKDRLVDRDRTTLDSEFTIVFRGFPFFGSLTLL